MKYLFIKYPLFFDTRMFTTRNTCAAAPPPRRRRRCRVTPKFDSVDCRVTDFIYTTKYNITAVSSLVAANFTLDTAASHRQHWQHWQWPR